MADAVLIILQDKIASAKTQPKPGIKDANKPVRKKQNPNKKGIKNKPKTPVKKPDN